MVPDADFVIQQATFMPGDILLMFTDGVIEARDPAGAFFTEARLRSLYRRSAPGVGSGRWWIAFMRSLPRISVPPCSSTISRCSAVRRACSSRDLQPPEGSSGVALTGRGVLSLVSKESMVDRLTVPGTLDSLEAIGQFVLRAAKRGRTGQEGVVPPASGGGRDRHEHHHARLCGSGPAGTDRHMV